MKLFFLISLLPFFTHQPSAADSGIHFLDMSYAEALELAKEQKKPLMLFFRLDSCPNCERMENSTFSDERVVRFFNENFLSLKINTMSLDGVRANRIYNVKTHPGIIFLDPEGNEAYRTIGFHSPESFILEASKALGGGRMELRTGSSN